MPIFNPCPETANKLIAEYESGVSIKSLSATYGIGKKTISKFLKRAGVKVKYGFIPVKFMELEQHADSIVAEYLAGATISALSQTYTCDFWSIKKLLKSKGVQPRKNWVRNTKSTKKFIASEQEQALAKEMYTSGKTLGEVSTVLGLCATTIRRLLISTGVQLRKAGPNPTPGTNRNSTLLRNYGIDQKRYLEMEKEQGGKCLICSCTVSDPRNNKCKYLSVDHDHKTGEVRGLLCHNCNRGIGYFLDNSELLISAAQYVNKSKTACVAVSS
jgi:hypothetical protein